MNKVIWKYPLKVQDVQNVIIPKGAELLSVQTQGDGAFLWALVNPKETETEARNIEIFGTGQPVAYDTGVTRQYISTFQMRGGALVFHAFEYTGV